MSPGRVRRTRPVFEKPWQRPQFSVSIQADNDGRLAAHSIVGTQAMNPVPLLPARSDRPVRFAVGTATRSASVWRVWANKTSDDVYASIATIEDLAKYSFHQSGEYMVHIRDFMHPHAARATVPFPSRRFDTWDRPEPWRAGWTHLLTIKVPGADVVDVRDQRYKRLDKVTWIPAAPLTDMTIVQLHLVDPAAPPLVGDAPSHTTPLGVIGGFQLPSGEVLLATAFTASLTRSERDELKAIRRDQHENPSDPNFSFDPALSPRLAVHHADGPDSPRQVWDLSYLGPR